MLQQEKRLSLFRDGAGLRGLPWRQRGGSETESNWPVFGPLKRRGPGQRGSSSAMDSAAQEQDAVKFAQLAVQKDEEGKYQEAAFYYKVQARGDWAPKGKAPRVHEGVEEHDPSLALTQSEEAGGERR